MVPEEHFNLLFVIQLYKICEKEVKNTWEDMVNTNIVVFGKIIIVHLFCMELIP